MLRFKDLNDLYLSFTCNYWSMPGSLDLWEYDKIAELTRTNKLVFSFLIYDTDLDVVSFNLSELYVYKNYVRA